MNATHCYYAGTEVYHFQHYDLFPFVIPLTMKKKRPWAAHNEYCNQDAMMGLFTQLVS